MTTRIDAEVLIPGRGAPIANGSVIFDRRGDRLRRSCRVECSSRLTSAAARHRRQHGGH
jgi:hypothetical protein